MTWTAIVRSGAHSAALATRRSRIEVPRGPAPMIATVSVPVIFRSYASLRVGSCRMRLAVASQVRREWFLVKSGNGSAHDDGLRIHLLGVHEGVTAWEAVLARRRGDRWQQFSRN